MSGTVRALPAPKNPLKPPEIPIPVTQLTPKWLDPFKSNF